MHNSLQRDEQLTDFRQEVGFCEREKVGGENEVALQDDVR